MGKRTFIITLDPVDPTTDVPGMMAFIQNSALFDSWWNHIPAVFLVTSDRNATEISDAMRQYTKDTKLLVMEVNPAESEGWLSDQSWTWIRRRAAERTEQRAAE
jgi:hypothetical protein